MNDSYESNLHVMRMHSLKEAFLNGRSRALVIATSTCTHFCVLRFVAKKLIVQKIQSIIRKVQKIAPPNKTSKTLLERQGRQTTPRLQSAYPICPTSLYNPPFALPLSPYKLIPGRSIPPRVVSLPWRLRCRKLWNSKRFTLGESSAKTDG